MGIAEHLKPVEGQGWSLAIVAAHDTTPEGAMTDWTKILPEDACHEAVEWAETQPSLKAAWANCERGDWMLWLAGKWSGSPRSKSRKTLVLTACACARLALKHIPKGEDRPWVAIETAEAWCRGEASLDEVRKAADAAYAAAAYAAWGAAWAAEAAWVAAAAASDAAWVAAWAADAAHAAYATRSATLKRCADIVREHYPKPPRRAP